jgi:hypothetical protein
MVGAKLLEQAIHFLVQARDFQARLLQWVQQRQINDVRLCRQLLKSRVAATDVPGKDEPSRAGSVSV